MFAQPTFAWRALIQSIQCNQCSGPFDAARATNKSRNGQLSPINAFSKNALDPSASAVSRNGADLAPLRDSYAPRASSSSRNGTGGGAGLSERAKAALSAMEDGKYKDEYGASSENLLGSPASRRSRRNSEGSITLGSYGNAKNEKERQYLEAFGVHGEAYEDFGNSRYARQAPRVACTLRMQGTTALQAVRVLPRVLRMRKLLD